MNANFKPVVVSSVILISASISTSAQADPQFTIQEQAAANPNLANAFRDMSAALKELEGAEGGYGGNRAKAIASLRSAMDFTKQALNYRMQRDEDKLDVILVSWLKIAKNV